MGVVGIVHLMLIETCLVYHGVLLFRVDRYSEHNIMT